MEPEAEEHAGPLAELRRRDLWILFFCALGVRLLYLCEIWDMPFVQVPIVDALAYDEWAQRIAAGDWIGGEVFYQAPLYPYFLASVYAIAGHQLGLVHVLQMAMGAASCVLVSLGTWSLFRDASVARVAGFGLALYPPAIFFDGLIGKQSLGLLLMTGLLWLLLRTQRAPTPREAIAAGALLGLLCLTRENALALVPALGLWMGWNAWRAAPPRRRREVLCIAAVAVGLSLVLMPVGLRNWAVGDTFALTTSQLGPNFYIGNNPKATGLYSPLLPGRQTPRFEAPDAQLLAERAEGRPLTRGEVSDYWLSRGFDFVREEPIAWILLLGRKTVLTWGEFEIPDVEDIYVYADWSWLLTLGLPVFHFGGLAGLAAGGVVLGWARRRDFALLVWLALVYTASVALFMTFARFRYPLVPLLLPLAALGLVDFVRLARARRFDGLVAPFTAFALVSAGTSIDLLDEPALRVGSYTNLGGIMLNEGRFEEAEEHLQRALEARPENADLQLHMAVLRFEQKRMDDARRHLERMRRVAPDDHRSWLLLARILRAEGKPVAARRARLRARALNPELESRRAPRGRDEGRGVEPAQGSDPTPSGVH